jgi:hypothetical protein
MKKKKINKSAKWKTLPDGTSLLTLNLTDHQAMLLENAARHNPHIEKEHLLYQAHILGDSLRKSLIGSQLLWALKQVTKNVKRQRTSKK